MSLFDEIKDVGIMYDNYENYIKVCEFFKQQGWLGWLDFDTESALPVGYNLPKLESLKWCLGAWQWSEGSIEAGTVTTSGCTSLMKCQEFIDKYIDIKEEQNMNPVDMKKALEDLGYSVEEPQAVVEVGAWYKFHDDCSDEPEVAELISCSVDEGDNYPYLMSSEAFANCKELTIEEVQAMFPYLKGQTI